MVKVSSYEIIFLFLLCSLLVSSNFALISAQKNLVWNPLCETVTRQTLSGRRVTSSGSIDLPSFWKDCVIGGKERKKCKEKKRSFKVCETNFLVPEFLLHVNVIKTSHFSLETAMKLKFLTKILLPDTISSLLLPASTWF